jgi:hypothetical protein
MDLILHEPLADKEAAAEPLARARALLRRPRRVDATGGAVLAALVLAAASITFVTVIVAAPSAPSVLVKR